MILFLLHIAPCNGLQGSVAQPAPERSTLPALLGVIAVFHAGRAISLEQRPTSTQKSRYLFQIQNSSQNISIWKQ